MKKTFFGYSSLQDLGASITGIYSYKSMLLNTVLTTGFSIGTFISDWVYPEPKAIWVLLFVLLGDWFTGMIRGAKSEEGFKTGLAFRIFPKIAIMGLILSGVMFGFGTTASSVIYAGMMGITLASLARNAAEIGWLKGQLAEFLIEYVDKNKKLKK